jgi:hypothetical protein
MATKTISVRVEAYEKLRRARRFPAESFSEVILRASWPEDTVTAEELLRRCRQSGAVLTDDELDAVVRLKLADRPPEDKWAGR